jgi:hypothetical protein
MSRTLLAVSLLLAATAAAAETRAWNFRVFLDEREIGWHSFTLRERGRERELRSEARFAVRVLSFDAYRYAHQATERWLDGCLRELVARTDDNGEREAVDWRGSGSGCDMSFAYWNPQILQARRLLNPQTGEYVAVSVAALGEETIEVRGERVKAQRHRLDGPGVRIDLWFAGDEWLALESPAKGGRRLRYVLR